MPFGAEPITGGGVRFRIWAPSVSNMVLRLESGGSSDFSMQRSKDGWHELNLASASPGDHYRFLLPDGLLVPDPASRFNPGDVHGASEVIDPRAFEWTDDDWHGQPWEQAIIYELHVGTFSATGDFAGVEARLDYLVELGVTALEIMPVADFPGHCNWGYDGVLPFAPDASYGRPEDFKRLVNAAHVRGLMVILDVVYNHFGPDGNYLFCYCQEFFNSRYHTQWGSAINFDGPSSRTVRDFFIHNALYWIEEYHMDGLRLDAIHAIYDNHSPDIVEEVRGALQTGPGRERHVHLILENDRNQAHYLESRSWQHGLKAGGVAQWNDDMHHALHVITTHETDGYYVDYAADPLMALTRCLAEGFAFQGEPSLFRRGAKRGEPSGHLPPTAFVNFLQTHDQIGNRAFGERLCHLASPAALEAVTTILLLAPQPPLIFMGEEFATPQPFLFFCDFSTDLAQAVTDGRRREFAKFAKFSNPATREHIPDPNAARTFVDSKLDWTVFGREPHSTMHKLYRRLLTLRRQEIVPRLTGMTHLTGNATVFHFGRKTFRLRWKLGDNSQLELLANLGADHAVDVTPAQGRLLFATSNLEKAHSTNALPPWSATWQLTDNLS